MTVQLALINQDPEPYDTSAELTYLRLSVIDAGSGGPDIDNLDVRLFPAVPISDAAVSPDGQSVVLTFAEPHLLNPTPITVESVASAPNTTSPTSINTTSAHNLITGAEVLIAGVLGNTAVNGLWPVTVTGPTTFTIPVAGNANYTGGGTVTGPVGQVVSVAVQNVVGFGQGLNTLWRATIIDGYHISVPFPPDASTPGTWVAGGDVTTLSFGHEVNTGALADFPAILGVTGNAVSPIVVTLSAPHDLGPVGTPVAAYLSDIAGNLAANGDFVATVVSATEISLPATGSGDYTGGGTILLGLQQTLAYHAGTIQPGWSGSVAYAALDPGTILVDLAPATPFESAALHLVRVLAADLASGVPPLVTMYSFTTLDDLPPAVLSAVALDRMTVQLSFYVPVAEGGAVFASVASGSDGQQLPQPVLNVVSTDGFPTSGTLYVGGSQVTYSDVTATAFLGCAGGTALLAEGDVVVLQPSTDALNPANYSLSVLAGLPAVGTVPGNSGTAGSLNVASVAAGFAPNVVVLTLDVPMTRGATYQVAVANVLDLSGNEVAPPTNKATFVGWTSVVPGRVFSLKAMWPTMNLLEDTTGDLQNILAVFQEVCDLQLGQIDQFLDILDPDIAPPAWLPSMLADQGNPFSQILGTLSTSDMRRLVHALVPIYSLKGTDSGVVEALNFFLGIVATVTYGATGGPGLGGAYLGPGTSATSQLAQPFALADGETLEFTIGGAGPAPLTTVLPYEVAFSADDFADITHATAAEVAAALNSFFSDNSIGAVAFVSTVGVGAHVASASDGVDLTTFVGAQTLFLDSTVGFAPSGTVRFPDESGAVVSYTGVTPMGLTGCDLVSGAGVISTGDTVNTNISLVSVENDYGSLAVVGGTALAAFDFPPEGALQLGASAPIELLTFYVNVPAGLSAQATKNGQAIVAYMKRAGTRPVWRPPQPGPGPAPLPLGEWQLGPGGTWQLL